MTTIDRLVELIRGQMESTEIQFKVLEWLKPYDGGKLDKRRLEKLRAEVGPADLRIRVVAGAMVNLEWGKEPNNVSLILAHGSTPAPVIDTAFILRSNPAHFAGAVKRNQDRTRALADRAGLTALATAVDRCVAAQAEHLAAREALKGLHGMDGPFGPYTHSIDEVFGLKE